MSNLNLSLSDSSLGFQLTKLAVVPINRIQKRGGGVKNTPIKAFPEK